MAARKLQQEVDKCFKKVSEGVAEFESIYEKIEQSTNAAQKEKLEDNLKREIKKLQRLRDQIKTWAASNDIKDKGPLLDNRKLIETQMEKFKAVEKAMKTKAYSKEGLSAAAKLDPKERQKMETCEFLSNTVDELERQIETLEAEGESIQATMKKGKSNGAKGERMAHIEHVTERHKWHQGKLELIKRSLENGGVEADQVTDLEESIKYYVSDGMNDDYMEDEEMYDELNLQEEEDVFGMNIDNDRVSSQDTQSVQEDVPEPEHRASIPSAKKPSSISEPPVVAARRPSTQMKSPLPASATLHAPLTNLPNGAAQMKPAPVPVRTPGEGLKYASVATAAAAKDLIAPLPPPPDAFPGASSGYPSLGSAQRNSVGAGVSPTAAFSQTTESQQVPASKPGVPPADLPSRSQNKSPAPSLPTAIPSSSGSTQAATIPKVDNTRPGPSRAPSGKTQGLPKSSDAKAPSSRPNGSANGVKVVAAPAAATDDAESVYHLPASLQDLMQSYEATQRAGSANPSHATNRMLAAAAAGAPDAFDLAPPREKSTPRYPTPPYYPQESNAVFDAARLYSKIDTDTLFYVFYYKQGTYQQYLAAKALKDQSWRFHKQYQTWFQRHEEPKTITEEFEQGTYRFFDYESTWMNRRKADFKFAYKFLEDDV